MTTLFEENPTTFLCTVGDCKYPGTVHHGGMLDNLLICEYHKKNMTTLINFGEKSPTFLQCTVKDCKYPGTIRPTGFAKERFNGLIMCDNHSNQYDMNMSYPAVISEIQVMKWEKALENTKQYPNDCCVRGCVHEALIGGGTEKSPEVLCAYHGPHTLETYVLDPVRVEKCKQQSKLYHYRKLFQLVENYLQSKTLLEQTETTMKMINFINEYKHDMN